MVAYMVSDMRLRKIGSRPCNIGKTHESRGSGGPGTRIGDQMVMRVARDYLWRWDYVVAEMALCIALLWNGVVRLSCTDNRAIN